MSLINDPAKILALLDESDSKSEKSQAASDIDVEDHLSERSNDSESEQDASDADSDSSDKLDLASVRRQVRQNFFKGKDETMWQKTPARPNVCTRAVNILSERQDSQKSSRNSQEMSSMPV